LWVPPCFRRLFEMKRGLCYWAGACVPTHRVRARAHTHTRTHTHIYTYTYIHAYTYIHSYMHACMHAYIRMTLNRVREGVCRDSFNLFEIFKTLILLPYACCAVSFLIKEV
jgi:hypothetical protein